MNRYWKLYQAIPNDTVKRYLANAIILESKKTEKALIYRHPTMNYGGCLMLSVCYLGFAAHELNAVAPANLNWKFWIWFSYLRLCAILFIAGFLYFRHINKKDAMKNESQNSILQDFHLTKPINKTTK